MKLSNITAPAAIAAEAAEAAIVPAATTLLANAQIHLAVGYGKIAASAKVPAAMPLAILELVKPAFL